MGTLRTRQWWLLPVIAILTIGFVSPDVLAAPSAQQASTVVQISNDAKFGNFLVDSDGRTLYTLSSEAGGSIQCSADCLTFWPPLLVPTGSSAPSAPAGLIGSLGTITRSDGTVQVTYNGFPVYTFAGDKAPGDTTGDGVAMGSGTWHVAVEAASSTGPTTTPPANSAPIQIANSPTLGLILVNPAGRTLYYNTNELGGHVVCIDKCLGAWPPAELAAGSTLSAIPGVTANLGTFTNPGGATQITYNGYPLYTFVHDAAAGDVNGEGIKAFGGVWLVARPNAVPLSAALAARVTVRITTTGGHVWGTVNLSYRQNGNQVDQTCLSATCRLILPAGVTLRLHQSPASAATWPFQEWKVRSGASHARVLSRSTIQLHVTSNSTVTTVYRAA